MAYLLRTLNLLMIAGILLTMGSAFGFVNFSMSHIQLAIPVFIYTIFAQAFVMFYFIGVSRLTDNVYFILTSEKNLNELFETPPENLMPYKKKVFR